MSLKTLSLPPWNLMSSSLLETLLSYLKHSISHLSTPHTYLPAIDAIEAATPSTPSTQRRHQRHRSSHQSSLAAIDAIFTVNDDDVLENISRDLARWENPRTSDLVFDVAWGSMTDLHHAFLVSSRHPRHKSNSKLVKMFFCIVLQMNFSCISVCLYRWCIFFVS